MTNEQFKSLKKVFNFVKPGIKIIGDSSFATILALLTKYDIDHKHFVVVDNKYVSFMLNYLSKLTLKNGKKGFILTWTNKPKQIFESISTPGKGKTCSMGLKINQEPDLRYISVNTWLEMGGKIEGFMMLGMQESTFVNQISLKNGGFISLKQWIQLGKSIDGLLEIKIGDKSAIEAGRIVTSEITKLCNYEESFVVKEINRFFYIDEIYVREIQIPTINTELVEEVKSDLPPTGAGKENKFIPLAEWLKTKSQLEITKARVINTPILSETVYFLASGKVLLDDRIIKYDISQIEVK